MSSLLVNRTRLAVGTAANALVDLVPGDSIAETSSQPAVTVPSRGSSASQPSPYRTLDFSTTCPSDSRHDAVFRDLPTSLFYKSLRRGSGAGASRKQQTGQGAAVLTLQLPDAEIAMWELALAADGSPTEANATAVTEPPATAAYMGSEVDWLFGGSDWLATLRTAARGGSISVVAEPVRENLLEDGDPPYYTRADIVRRALSATLTVVFRDSAADEAAKLLTRNEGVLVVRRRDAAYGYAFPAVHAGVSPSAPNTGAATADLEFSQSSAGYGTMGVPVVGGAGVTQSVSASQVGYLVKSDRIETVAAGTNNKAVAAGELLVFGAPYKL